MVIEFLYLKGYIYIYIYIYIYEYGFSDNLLMCYQHCFILI